MSKIKKYIKKSDFLMFVVLFAISPFKLLYKYITYIKSVFFSVVYFNSVTLPVRNHLTIGIKNLGVSRVYFPHPVGLVIGKGVEIGKYCKIYQNVTIGAKNDLAISYPRIGDNVTIYANAIILGDITIGNNCIIGAGTLVMENIPDNSIVVGNPMRVLAKKAH